MPKLDKRQIVAIVLVLAGSSCRSPLVWMGKRRPDGLEGFRQH